MGTHFRRTMLLVGACMLSALCVWGQQENSSADPLLEVAVEFQAMRANTVPADTFWTQGGGLQATFRVTRHWGVTADLSGQHAGRMPGSSAGLDLITVSFGPRYTLSLPHGRFKIYGQALAGPAHGSNSIFPGSQGSTSSANGIALLVGGGLDYPISHRLFVRALDAAWLRTTFLNGTTTVQNNLRLGAGLGYRF